MYHTVTATAKFKRFVRALRDLVPPELLKVVAVETIAVGLLERVWHTAMSSAPRGDVGRITDAEIAEHCGWFLDPSALIEALLAGDWLHRDSRWRLVVHDWHEHAPRFCRGIASRNGGFATVDSDYMRATKSGALLVGHNKSATEGTEKKRTEQVPVIEPSTDRGSALPIAGDLFRRLDVHEPSALLWSVALAVARGAVPRTVVLDCADSTARNCTGNVESYFRAAVGKECRARGIAARASFPPLPKDFGDISPPGTNRPPDLISFVPKGIPDGPYDKKRRRGTGATGTADPA